jgi:hypothetical protein
MMKYLTSFFLLALAGLHAGTPRPIAATLKPFVDDQVLAGAVTLLADKDKVLDVSTVDRGRQENSAHLSESCC